MRERPAAGRRFTEGDDLPHVVVADDKDALLGLGVLQHGGERDGARVVQRDALGELDEDSADRGLASRTREHSHRRPVSREDPARHGPALDHRGECDATSIVDRGRAEAGERATRRGGIALRHHLRQPPGNHRVHGLHGLAPAPHRGQKREIAVIVQRRSVDGRDRSGRHSRRAAPREHDRPQTARVAHENSLDGAAADDRRRERHVAALVQRGNRVAAKARKRAAARHGITFGYHADRALRRGEEECLAGGRAQDGREERHLSFRVRRRDDRQRLDAEVLERAAARSGIAGDRHGPDGGLRACAGDGHAHEEHAQHRRELVRGHGGRVSPSGPARQ